MQRYYFDTFDGVVILDDEGVMMPDLASARGEAKRLLAEMVYQSAPEKDATEFRSRRARRDGPAGADGDAPPDPRSRLSPRDALAAGAAMTTSIG